MDSSVTSSNYNSAPTNTEYLRDRNQNVTNELNRINNFKNIECFRISLDKLVFNYNIKEPSITFDCDVVIEE